MIRSLQNAVIVVLALAHAAALADVPALADGGERDPGRFIWADLLTDDPQMAKGFYENVFEWRFQATEQPEYMQIYNGERAVAGMFEHAPRDSNVNETQWLPSVSVRDVDGSTALARNWGGTIFLEPEDFPARGRHAVVADPSGATLALLRTSDGDPSDVRQPNDLIWADLLTNDPTNAAQFFAGVVGYSVGRHAEGGADYTLLTSGGQPRAGVVMNPWREVGSHWLLYVWVPDVYETLRRVRANGGQVLLEPTDSGDDAIAIISDTTGGVLAVQARNNR